MTTTKGVYYLGPATHDGALRERDILFNAPVVAVDIETVSLDDRTILGISFSPNHEEAFYYPINGGQVPWNILVNPKVSKVYHNAHFDIKSLEDYLGARIGPVDDTLIMAKMSGSKVLALADIVLELYGTKPTTIEDLLGPKGKDQKTMLDIPYEQVVLKCCNDTKWTYRLWEHYLGKIPPLAYDLDMRYLPLVMDIERAGMMVHSERLAEHTAKAQKDRNYYRGVCIGMGFNPGSTQQVAAMLQYHGYHISYYRKTGNPIMDKKTLEDYYWDSPIAQLTILYRKADKLLSTYLRPLPEKFMDENGRIHGTINIANTESGRTSRSKPNLQNQPPAIRDIYCASPGNVFEERDLSQIELRELAYQMMLKCGEPTMWDLYQKELTTTPMTITDLHTETAGMLNKSRRIGKNANFTIAYMGTEYSLYTKQGIPLAEGWQIIRDLKRMYPGIDQLIALTEKQLWDYGYTETRLGLRTVL